MVFGVFIVIKSDNRACLVILDSMNDRFIINHSIHSMLTMDTNILQSVVYTMGMFMEERKIAL